MSDQVVVSEDTVIEIVETVDRDVVIVSEPGGTEVIESLERHVVIVDEKTVDVVEVATQGPPGATGAKGDPGLTSPPFEHEQSVPSATWVIHHGLGRYPAAVLCADTAGTQILGGVHLDSIDQVTVTYTAPVGGKAQVL